MEAFEEWLDEKRPTQQHKWEMVNFEWGLKSGWRAALEWVLEQEYNYDKPEVYNTIRDELEDK